MDDFDQRKAAQQVRKLVRDPEVRDQLRGRNLLGVMRRYAPSDDEAIARFRKARIGTARSEYAAYTILDDADRIIGMATVLPDLKLKRQRFRLPSMPISLPPLLAKGPLVEQVPVTGPEVSAWTNEQNGGEHLVDAYRQLLSPQGIADTVFATRRQKQTNRPHRTPMVVESNAWTIEPLEAAKLFHIAIRSAGLEETGRGVYDDGESVRLFPPETPPVGVFYTRFGPEGLDTAA
ncbi:MAG: hypothetical protein JWM81_958 [Candidatus Saccharibacteria bacterium]|nr:hypothetical protein [Candidatus Saccharibacteria bacterium]